MNASAQATAAFNIQGYRGARGLMPENTIPAFLKALELGVATLEMDVVFSSDNKLGVSHDPYFSGEISLDRNGLLIRLEKQNDYKLYQYELFGNQAVRCRKFGQL